MDATLEVLTVGGGRRRNLSTADLVVDQNERGVVFGHGFGIDVGHLDFLFV
ncbi:hypothetical protein [Aestuariicoccus sp. MJ-SS9]|uniref:hypothetical protein n=1 Tax=Aestuariicoccus sp. MJ-SS9 TaxID=3079855 RepID=UPI00290C6A05|nr:hypothetical protein [Aestuariicoccus sp. MJ-SS9]MDU8912467.1 hypothetical protein [Aestuariicoccus sp. MJ-SS9]